MSTYHIDTATDQPSIVQALSAVMADVQAVRKGDRNAQQGYQFRGIDAVVNAVGPVLRAHGVVVVPTQVESHYRDVRTVNDKPSRECTVTVTYRFYGPAGDYLDAMVPGESMDFGDKGAPKAMSVAFRIALLQALCIPTDEPDPDSQSYERAAPARPVSQATAEILDAIRAAGSREELTAVWNLLRGSAKAGRLAPADSDRLNAEWCARRDALAAQQPAEVPA